jgi:hypothetical protein
VGSRSKSLAPNRPSTVSSIDARLLDDVLVERPVSADTLTRGPRPRYAGST